MAGTDAWFTNQESGASSHFGIGKDGTIHQYVALEDAAWANGKMQTPDMSIPWVKDCYEHGVNPNLCTVSIEYEGAHSGPPDWAPTEAQYQAGLALTRWLCEQLGITPDPHTIVGHFQIDSVDRPYCPGPKFPFSRMLSDLRPAPSIPSIPVVLLDGRTVQGELRGQTTYVPVGDQWLPVPVGFKLVYDYFMAKGRPAAEKYFWQNSVSCYKWVRRNARQPGLRGAQADNNHLLSAERGKLKVFAVRRKPTLAWALPRLRSR
jgi:hypothetical protein